MEKEKIKDIADNLDLGMRCFVNSISKEIKFIPDYDQISALEVDLDPIDADKYEIKPNSDYIEIKRMNARESFTIMSEFADSVDDESLKRKLIQSLDMPKPFQNFKVRIDNSGNYREKWFAFKDRKLSEWVESQLNENKL